MTTSVPGNGKTLADSYGGVVAALNELRRKQGLAYKAYDSSFAGIVEAIRDLSVLLVMPTMVSFRLVGRLRGWRR